MYLNIKADIDETNVFLCVCVLSVFSVRVAAAAASAGNPGVARLPDHPTFPTQEEEAEGQPDQPEDPEGEPQGGERGGHRGPEQRQCLLLPLLALKNRESVSSPASRPFSVSVCGVLAFLSVLVVKKRHRWQTKKCSFNSQHLVSSSLHGEVTSVEVGELSIPGRRFVTKSVDVG